VRNEVDNKIEQEKHENRILQSKCSKQSSSNSGGDDDANDDDASDEMSSASHSSISPSLNNLSLNIREDGNLHTKNEVVKAKISFKMNEKYKKKLLSDWHERLTTEAIDEYFKHTNVVGLDSSTQGSYMMTSTACDDDDGSERVRDSDDTERFLCESDEISKVLLLNNLENGMYAQYAVHALQSGSFMYGLSTKSSDQDFDVVKKKKKRKIDRKRLFQLLLLLLLLLFLFFTPVFIDVLLSILILSLSLFFSDCFLFSLTHSPSSHPSRYI
jgi:hypothetical protein